MECIHGSKNVKANPVADKARRDTATTEQVAPGNLFAQPRRKKTKKRVPRNFNPIEADSDEEDDLGGAGLPSTWTHEHAPRRRLDLAEPKPPFPLLLPPKRMSHTAVCWFGEGLSILVIRVNQMRMWWVGELLTNLEVYDEGMPHAAFACEQRCRLGDLRYAQMGTRPIRITYTQGTCTAT